MCDDMVVLCLWFVVCGVWCVVCGVWCVWRSVVGSFDVKKNRRGCVGAKRKSG